MFGTDDRADPSKYIGYSKVDSKIKTTFGDQYRVDPNSGIGGQYPWNPGRNTVSDILNNVQSRKRDLNSKLGFVDAEAPLDTQLFIGLGRFTRHDDYDFLKGQPIVSHRPQDNPDFNPVWMEAYKISPTIPPNKRAKSPMPTAANPDPHGYIMQMSENQAQNTVDPQPSVANLLSKSKEPKPAKELGIEEKTA
jgi:hypothetical protein